MTDYSTMSDHDISKKVGFVLGMCWANLDPNYNTLCVWQDGKLCVFDPCNSWADAGPIIESKLICLAADVFAEPQDGGRWVAQPAYGWDHERVRSDNPLRAAMIVFLMMNTKTEQEVKNDERY